MAGFAKCYDKGVFEFLIGKLVSETAGFPVSMYGLFGLWALQVFLAYSVARLFVIGRLLPAIHKSQPWL